MIAVAQPNQPHQQVSYNPGMSHLNLSNIIQSTQDVPLVLHLLGFALQEGNGCNTAFDFGDCRVDLWCLPKIIDAAAHQKDILN